MLIDTIQMLDGAQILQEDGVSKYTGAAIYDIAGSTLSQPTDAAVIMRFSVNRPFSLPIGLAGSFAESVVTPTGTVAYSLKKNGASIGTINFSSGSNVASFTFSSAVTFVAGDILTLEAPATADASHDELAWTFSGTLA